MPKASAQLHVLFSPERIQARLDELARRINHDYRGKEIVLIGVLKGAFIFMADLARRLQRPLRCDFMRVASYGNCTTANDTVRIELDITQSIRGKYVLVIEDIIDTGATARAVLDSLRAKKPKSVKLCALIRKRGRERVRVNPDYVGFVVPNRFVVGYGLDYAGRYRHLPCLAVLPSVGAGR